MRAVVDPDLCIGCEKCVAACPEVFRMEDDKAVAFADPVPAGSEDACRQASDDCPVSAIGVQDT